jgi:hypothetical protein
MKIQASFKAHFYYKLFKDYYNRKGKTKKFIYIIQKVLFLNLYYLKVNPKRKFALSKNIFTKYIYTFDSLNKIIYLQREIKYYLSSKRLKLIENKKKCVYVKPYTINPLNKIRLLQRNIVLFLERLRRRHKVQTSQMIVKRVDFSKKIILIQRLARAIHTDIIYPQILKTNFCEKFIPIILYDKPRIVEFPRFDCTPPSHNWGRCNRVCYANIAGGVPRREGRRQHSAAAGGDFPLLTTYQASAC